MYHQDLKTISSLPATINKEPTKIGKMRLFRGLFLSTMTKPKGILVPIGGGEDSEDILERIKQLSGKREPHICYMTTATTSPEEAAQKHRKFFKDMGVKASIIHFDSRPEADTPENLTKIDDAHVLFMGGGDQLRLSSLLAGTELMRRIKGKYITNPSFVLCGNSAGAAAMPGTMIISGSSQDALVKGELELTSGLDLINNMVIDTHFTQRGRFGRLIQTVTYNPGVLGLGLSVDTGVIIKRGEEMEVIGSGLVVIVDGRGIEYSNLAEIPDGTPITVEGIRMHVLGPGTRFNIEERKIRN